MSSSCRLGVLAGSVLLLVSTRSGDAMAQASGRSVTAEDAALAETLFRDGRALLEASKVDAACIKLEGSHKLDPKVSTLLNVAACHEIQGRTASAWAEFLEAARLARGSSARDPRALEQTARVRAEALSTRIHRIALERPEQLPKDVELLLDGRPIPRIAWSTPIPVDPGEHVLTAQAPRKVSWTGRIAVSGAPSVHPLTVPARAVAPVVVVPPPRSSGGSGVASLDEPNRLESLPFLAGAGLALVGVGVGVWQGLSAITLKKQRDRECDDSGCSEEGLRLQSDAGAAATRSTIAFAVGGAGAAFAIYWLVRPSSSKTASSKSAVPVTGACAPGGCSIAWRGSF